MDKQPLSEEELNKLKEILPKDSFEFYERQFNNQLNLFPEAAKLIDCPVELSFNIAVKVLEQDSDGRNIGVLGLSDFTYHIPVPSGVDHNVYVRAFLKHFEDTIVVVSDKTDVELSLNKDNNNE